MLKKTALRSTVRRWHRQLQFIQESVQKVQKECPENKDWAICIEDAEININGAILALEEGWGLKK